MQLTIQVNAAPYQHQAADTAYHFTKAAIEMGHHITRVFFYHDGVYNASDLSAPPQDDRNIVSNWAELTNNDGQPLDLVICVAAALRRGILDKEQQQRYAKRASNLHPQFRIAGLGQLIEASIQSERLIVFDA